jgi:hypothetical protein
MSKFRIGMRVRVRYSENAARYGDASGKEGLIWQEVNNEHGHGWAVHVDGWSPYRPSGYPHWFLDRQLEPIQPSGAAPSDYSFTELMDRCRAGGVECV